MAASAFKLKRRQRWPGLAARSPGGVRFRTEAGRGVRRSWLQAPRRRHLASRAPRRCLFKELQTMTVASVMTGNPAVCTPDSKLSDVARMMLDHDCGQIPVVQDLASRKLTGVITDRDIAIRVVAKGSNSAEARASDCMSTPCISVTPETSLEACCEAMENNKIRRVPVVDGAGAVVGIVSLADVVQNAKAATTAEVVKQVSSGT
jgi:CBS domain-containing protein